MCCCFLSYLKFEYISDASFRVLHSNPCRIYFDCNVPLDRIWTSHIFVAGAKRVDSFMDSTPATPAPFITYHKIIRMEFLFLPHFSRFSHTVSTSSSRSNPRRLACAQSENCLNKKKRMLDKFTDNFVEKFPSTDNWKWMRSSRSCARCWGRNDMKTGEEKKLNVRKSKSRQKRVWILFSHYRAAETSKLAQNSQNFSQISKILPP